MRGPPRITRRNTFLVLFLFPVTCLRPNWLRLRSIAMTLPWLELLCGLMVAARVWLRPALALASMLSAAFAMATGQAWARGLDISCGCLKLSLLGLSAEATGAWGRLFDSVGFAFFRALLLGAAALYLLRQKVEMSGEEWTRAAG